MLGYLLLLHGLAIFSLIFIPLSWVYSVLISFLLVLHCFYYLRRKNSVDAEQWVERLVYSDQHWRLWIKEREVLGNLQQATIWQKLIVLNFIDSINKKNYSVLLFPDSADTDQLRQLRIILRHQPF
jgi:predicted MPP superfamily phosphohydrolase